MEEWCVIRTFPTYSVSSLGRVRNDRTDRILVLAENREGIVNVGLCRDRVKYKRSVTVLVANAFVSKEPYISFNTPINLDGDRTNNHFCNLMWRPRWFAIDYHRQFRPRARRGFLSPVEDVKTGEYFDCSMDAAIKYGLLDWEIKLATINRTYVWPTYQKFRLI